MRDLTKSMISFSWVTSLFGVQQMANLLSLDKATESINKVTDATKKELGGATEASFRAGDNLQRGLVDLTFSMLSPQILNPNTWIKMTSDAAQQTMRVLGQVIPGAPAPSVTSPHATGWGPVPPPGK